MTPTARAMLAAIAAGGPVPGRHLIVTAHPDDETIALGGLLSRLSSAPTLLQLTDGSQATDPDRAAVADRRRRERADALAAGGWAGVTEIDAGQPGREAHRHVEALTDLVVLALEHADVVWTHPYEGGHLDHDTAAYVVARALGRSARRPVALEFASYFMSSAGRSVFGDFWPDAGSPATTVALDPADRARKYAALAAYTSQANILRKFRAPGIEHYRAAPQYNFAAPPPPPLARWDVRGYSPSTAEWRATVREVGK